MPRPMERGDLEAVLRIQEKTGFLSWSAEQYLSELSQRYSLAFVHENATIVQGYALWHLLADEAELLAVAVDPDCQGQGLATAMMEQMHTILGGRGAKSFFLEVRRSNVPAQALYRRLGYKVLGTRARYYENGEDALLMGKSAEP